MEILSERMALMSSHECKIPVLAMSSADEEPTSATVNTISATNEKILDFDMLQKISAAN